MTQIISTILYTEGAEEVKAEVEKELEILDPEELEAERILAEVRKKICTCSIPLSE